MSLPADWTDRLFDRLTVVYGHHFLGRWSGMDINAVKADWSRELGFYRDKPNAIRYALEHLPADNPPNVLQFRALCSNAPDDKPLQLPPPPSPDGLRKVAEAMSGQKVGGVTFAELLERHRKLRAEGRQSKAQRDWLKAVEAMSVVEATINSDAPEIPDHLLPPEMRRAA